MDASFYHAKRFWFIFAVLVVFTVMLGACAYTPQQQYQDFLLDLDIVTRMDICIDKVSNYTASFYTASELHALQADIASWTNPYEEALESNKNLTQCCSLLLSSIEAYRADDMPLADTKLEDALKYYQEALAFIRRNNAGSIDV